MESGTHLAPTLQRLFGLARTHPFITDSSLEIMISWFITTYGGQAQRKVDTPALRCHHQSCRWHLCQHCTNLPCHYLSYFGIETASILFRDGTISLTTHHDAGTVVLRPIGTINLSIIDHAGTMGLKASRLAGTTGLKLYDHAGTTSWRTVCLAGMTAIRVYSCAGTTSLMKKLNPASINPHPTAMPIGLGFDMQL